MQAPAGARGRCNSCRSPSPNNVPRNSDSRQANPGRGSGYAPCQALCKRRREPPAAEAARALLHGAAAGWSRRPCPPDWWPRASLQAARQGGPQPRQAAEGALQALCFGTAFSCCCDSSHAAHTGRGALVGEGRLAPALGSPPLPGREWAWPARLEVASPSIPFAFPAASLLCRPAVLRADSRRPGRRPGISHRSPREPPTPPRAHCGSHDTRNGRARLPCALARGSHGGPHSRTCGPPQEAGGYRAARAARHRRGQEVLRTLRPLPRPGARPARPGAGHENDEAP